MRIVDQLKKEVLAPQNGEFCPACFRGMGYLSAEGLSPAETRGHAIAALFSDPGPFIYKNDLIVGSLRPLFGDFSAEDAARAKEAAAKYPERHFLQNCDHYAPDYESAIALGIGGLLDKIAASEEAHADNAESLQLLSAMRMTLHGLQKRILGHATLARELIATGAEGYDPARLAFIAENCEAIATAAPATFAQGLQLVWMLHSCFVYEGRYAMALARMDQYLYPLYRRDIEAGRLTQEDAVELLENALIKICERRFVYGNDDVVNICVGGVDADGNCAVNDLSYCLVWAVKNINLPGPNLSARITPDTPDEFLDECLKSIGTGLGYPALMNDTVNMEALRRFGYDEVDIRNYSMVGCIENFITGMQPPWSDGRFDTPRYIEYVMFGGKSHDGVDNGITPLPLSEITSMDVFMKEVEAQIAAGVKTYVEQFHRENIMERPEDSTSPFLSVFCRDCIERGKDVNNGGSHYPSVHGVGLMGIGTMSDALAAVEKVVFCDHETTLEELAEAMKSNFVGYEALREKLLAAPKYGNNDDFVDKYALWFVNFQSDQFDLYRTPDGGGIYTAISANINNIDAGHLIGATPDGRLAGEPLSDAASPTYGRDNRGATATVLSVTKPDYTKVACGTVINQKYSPSMFEDGKRDKLRALIRVYFAKGGQEMQINATSTEVLKDAMDHPEKYPDLVVRVSGFSALYVTLAREVQMDILARTQQE